MDDGNDGFKKVSRDEPLSYFFVTLEKYSER